MRYDLAMKLRFYVDPESRQPHIRGHGVDEAEVEEVLMRPIEDLVITPFELGPKAKRALQRRRRCAFAHSSSG